jgi:hypothetical protein
VSQLECPVPTHITDVKFRSSRGIWLHMKYNDLLSGVAEKLDTLKRLDRRQTVFGAGSHKYRSICVTPTALSALEYDMQVKLPDEYRNWLLNVGYGAGPYYGLYPPERVLARFRSYVSGTGGEVASPASITARQVDRYLEQVRTAGSYVGIRITADTFDGAVPIGEQGCSGETFLVVSGPLAGTVFGESGDLIDEPWTAAAAFWPDSFVRDPYSLPHPLSFLNWMESWIDVSIAELA